MVTYTVNVYTANYVGATTFNNVYMSLVGTDGESDRTELKSWTPLTAGSESTFSISCPNSLGQLLLIKLDKQPLPLFPEDAWFPAKVEVISPGGDIYTFPIHHWITDSKTHSFREGKALTIMADLSKLGRLDREKELEHRADKYKWDMYHDGVPHVMKADDPKSLPLEVQFSFTKKMEFDFTAVAGLMELQLKGLSGCMKNWPSLESFGRHFWRKDTLSDFVQEHWREDAFFGYEVLNGVNPILIQRCRVLPENFPVTDSMVKLHGEACLSDEMEKGNIYLCNYRNVHDVQTNIINGKKQYLAAPLVLLHKTHQDELKPVAIQLKQDPADDNPIFFPTDSEYDWLMAKIFVRSAHFNEHQLNSHLLRTHLLAEVFAVSLLRNMPMVHPLYKLLVPHTRYTLQINCLARSLLINEDDGVFTEFAASGGRGMYTILKRSLKKMTYASLCLPEDIKEREMEDMPNYYYREDGLKLWHIIHRFVDQVLSLYYKGDQDVKDDTELQTWISDIFEHGFLSRSGRGFPESFSSVRELVKFVTMVIFTCSAQHSAVNTGQYDYGGWMPNTPITLKLPPPTTKGAANEDTLLETLPNIDTTVHGMAVLWLLSKQSSDFVALGQYPEERFTEEAPRKLIMHFQKELARLSHDIKARNKNMRIPYTYLDPALMENSVAL